MSNGLLVRLIPLTPAMVTTVNGIDLAFPVGNLADPQPKLVWQTSPNAAASGCYIRVDLGADTQFDTVCLLFGNFSAASNMRVSGATEAQGAPVAPGSGNLSGYAPTRVAVSSGATRFHALRSFAPYTGRYLIIQIDDPGPIDPALALRAGVIGVGQSWLNQYNFELGAGRRITDLSDKRTLPGGEIGRWRKAKVPSFRATWSNLTDAELRALWAILSEAGESEPLLLIEDPDATAGLHERIHYGTLDGIDFYERVQVDKAKIELRLTEWL